MEPLDAGDPAEIGGYQLRARLGSGGMGRVYLAATSAGRPVAIKVVRPELGDDPEFRRRFRQEVDASRRVHGMYTAQVLDAGLDATPPWLVTAYVPGPSLHQAVAAHGPMPEQTVFALIAGVAEALAVIHQAGIVHRDLKPSNVLLAPDGPRVIDFGIARAADATVLTGTGALIGSPPFMTPEQVTGAPVTPATDVFALGSVAVFTATARPPFGEGADLTVLYRVAQAEPDLTGCPPRLAALAGRCLAKDPAARPSTAQVIAECQAQAAGQPGTAGLPWLPPDVLAQLAPPLVPSGPSASSGSSAPWASPAGPTPPSAAAPVTLESFYRQQAPAVPAARSAVSGRQALIGAGVVFGVAALAAIAVFAFSHHGGSPAPGPTAAHSLAAGGSSPPAPPTASGAASAAVDSCLVGTWKDTGDVLINTNNFGQDIKMTGSGGGLTIKPDGSVTQQFGPETLTGTAPDGTVWTEVIDGTATMQASTSNHTMRFGQIQVAPSATYKLYKDGIYNADGPMTVSTGANAYTCSPSTLHMSWSNGSSVYDRVR